MCLHRLAVTNLFEDFGGLDTMIMVRIDYNMVGKDVCVYF